MANMIVDIWVYISCKPLLTVAILNIMRAMTRYFGFVTVIICWVGLVILACIQEPNWSEPISQFGFYPATTGAFGIAVTLAATCWYLFSRHLDIYWRGTSLVTLLASGCFILVGWVPYEPYTREFVFDLHNVAVVLAMLLYSLPLLFISYTKKHEKVAHVSRILFFVITFLAGWSIVARVYDIGIIYAQLVSLLPPQIWLTTTNILLLKHTEKTVPNQYTEERL